MTSNKRSQQAKIQELEAKKQELLQKQLNLVEDLKTKHAKLYDWLVENQINLNDLSKYTTNIAFAIAVLFNVVYGPVPTTATLTHPQINPAVKSELTIKKVETISLSELKGLNEDQKGKLVWERYGGVINGTAVKYNVDPKLIFATIMIESGGNNQAIRYEPHLNDSSYGLGQLLYSTARWIGFDGKPTDLYDPVTNIDLIARYHRKNLDMYGNLTPVQLTTAYNAGSPYSRAYPGHLVKFEKWYQKAQNLVV